MSNVFDSVNGKSISDLVREFLQSGSVSPPGQRDAAASSSPSSCCNESKNPCVCDSISKAEHKLKTMKVDSVWPSSVPCGWAASAYQQLTSTASRDLNVDSSSSSPVEVSAPSVATDDPGVQNVQKFLQMSSCNQKFDLDFMSKQQLNVSSSFPNFGQSSTLWHRNDSAHHSEELNYSGSPWYCPRNVMDKISAPVCSSKNLGCSSASTALGNAGSLFSKSLLSSGKFSDSDTDIDIIETAVKEPEVITLNDDSGDEGNNKTPVEEGEIISCVTSPVPQRSDSPVTAVKELTTLREKLCKMEFFAETRRLAPTPTSSLHALDQSSKEKKIKRQVRTSLERGSTAVKRKKRGPNVPRQRKKSKKENPLVAVSQKPTRGTLAELLQEKYPERFSKRVGKKSANDSSIAVVSTGDLDNCGHPGSDIEEEELVLRKLALESVVVSLENENQRRARVVLSPFEQLVNKDGMAEDELNLVTSKDCETPVDMEISNSDAEIESKQELYRNHNAFTFPIEWAYMIPPPAAAHQHNDLNSFESFSYEQNLCKQAMESSVQNNFAEGYGTSYNFGESMAPQSIYPEPAAATYPSKSAFQYSNQCTSTGKSLPLNVLAPSVVGDASGSGTPSSYGYTLSQANAYNQEAFMNAVAKQTKSNEANLIHIKLNKAPAAKKTRKRGKRSNKVLNKAQSLNTTMAHKEAHISADHCQPIVQSDEEELSLRKELLRSLHSKSQAVGSSDIVQSKSNVVFPLQSSRIISGSPVSNSEVPYNSVIPPREDARPKSSAAESVPVKLSFRYPKPIIINLDEDSDSDDPELHFTSATASSGISSPGNTEDLLRGPIKRHLEGISNEDSGATLSVENSCPTVMKHLSRSSQAEYHFMQRRMHEIYEDRKRRRDSQARLRRLAADKDQMSTASDTSNDCSQSEQSCFSNATEVKNVPVQSNDGEINPLTSKNDTTSVVQTGHFHQASVFGRLGQELPQQTSTGPQYDELFKDTDIDERGFLASLYENTIGASAKEPECEEDLRNLLLSKRVKLVHDHNGHLASERFDQCEDLREVLSSSVRKSDLVGNSNEQNENPDEYTLQSISEKIDCYLKSIRRSSTLKGDTVCVEERSESSNSNSLSSSSDSSSEGSSSSTDSEQADSDSDTEGNKENSPIDQNADIFQSKCVQTLQDHTLQPSVQHDVFDKYSNTSECVAFRQKLSIPTSDPEHYKDKLISNEAIVAQAHHAFDTGVKTNCCVPGIDHGEAKLGCTLGTPAGAVSIVKTGTNVNTNNNVAGTDHGETMLDCALGIGAGVPAVKTGTDGENKLLHDSNISMFDGKKAVLQSGVGEATSEVSNVEYQPCFDEVSLQSRKEKIFENKNKTRPSAGIQNCVSNLGEQIDGSKSFLFESNAVCTPVLEMDGDEPKKFRNSSSASTSIKQAVLSSIEDTGACAEALKSNEIEVYPTVENEAHEADSLPDVHASVSSSCELEAPGPEHSTAVENVTHFSSTVPSSEHEPSVIGDVDSAARSAELAMQISSMSDDSTSSTAGSPASIAATRGNFSSECEAQETEERKEKSLPLGDKPPMTTDVSVKGTGRNVLIKNLSASGASVKSSSSLQRHSSGSHGSSKIKQSKLLMLSKYEHLIQERKGKLQSLQADVKRQAEVVRSADNELLNMRGNMEKLEKALAVLRAQFKKKSGEHFRSSQRLTELQGQAAADSFTLSKLHAAAQQLGKQVVSGSYGLECKSSGVALGRSGETGRHGVSTKRPPLDNLSSPTKRHKTWTRSSGYNAKWSNNLSLLSKARTSPSGSTSPRDAVINNKSATVGNACPVIRKSSNFRLDNRPLAQSPRSNAAPSLSCSRSCSKSPSSLPDKSPKRDLKPLSESELRNRLLKKLQQNSRKQADLRRTSGASDAFCPFGLLGTCNDENCTFKHLPSEKGNREAKSNTFQSSPAQQLQSVEAKVMLNSSTNDYRNTDAPLQVSTDELKSSDASEDLSRVAVTGKFVKGKSLVSEAENKFKTDESSCITQKIESDSLEDDKSDNSSSDSDDSDSSSSDSDSDSDSSSSSDSSVVDSPTNSASIASDSQDKNASLNENEGAVSNVDAPSAISCEKENSRHNQVSVSDSGGLTDNRNDKSDECASNVSVSMLGSESQCAAQADGALTGKSARSCGIGESANLCSRSELLRDASIAEAASAIQGTDVVGSSTLGRARNQKCHVATANVGLQNIEEEEELQKSAGVRRGVEIAAGKLKTKHFEELTGCDESIHESKGHEDQTRCCGIKVVCREGAECDKARKNGNDEELLDYLEVRVECTEENVKCGEEHVKCVGNDAKYDEEAMEYSEGEVEHRHESVECFEKTNYCSRRDVEGRKGTVVSREDMVCEKVKVKFIENEECYAEESMECSEESKECSEESKERSEESKERGEESEESKECGEESKECGEESKECSEESKECRVCIEESKAVCSEVIEKCSVESKEECSEENEAV